MKSKEHIKETLRKLFASQNLAVLATQYAGEPYTSLVAFAATEDLKQLFFVTGQSTRKYANLRADSRAAMLIDNRSNEASDVAHATAATVMGIAEAVPDDETKVLGQLYLKKHPHLKEFMDSPSTVFVKLRVERYYVVSRFQEVTELRVTP